LETLSIQNNSYTEYELFPYPNYYLKVFNWNYGSLTKLTWLSLYNSIHVELYNLSPKSPDTYIDIFYFNYNLYEMSLYDGIPANYQLRYVDITHSDVLAVPGGKPDGTDYYVLVDDGRNDQPVEIGLGYALFYWFPNAKIDY
ncbi:MAG: hypothetical protein ORN85_08725, partial [Sediminibacterium sp.]|nr:hypothetical protein [Sediminibacterium sp.]